MILMQTESIELEQSFREDLAEYEAESGAAVEALVGGRADSRRRRRTVVTSPMEPRERFLVTTDWLAANLDARLHVFGLPAPSISARATMGSPATPLSAAAKTWSASHIPGSGFADLPGDLSDPGTRSAS